MTMPNTSGVYAICHQDGREYIGSSKSIATRIRTHKRDLRRGTHSNQRLQNSWNTHGESAFTFVVLECCASEDRLVREQFYINTRNAYYNIAPVAGTTEGYRFTRAQRLNIAKARGLVTYKFQGEDRTLAEIAELVGKPIQLLWRRIEKQGLSLEEAISRTHRDASATAAKKQWKDPAKVAQRAASISAALTGKPNIKRRKLYDVGGTMITLQEMAELTGAPASRLQARLSRGIDPNEVVKYASYRSLRHAPGISEKYAEIARNNVLNRAFVPMSEDGRERQRKAVVAYNKTRAVTAATKKKMSEAKRSKAVRYDVCGESLSILDMSERWGVDRTVIYHRIKNGWDPERAAKDPIGTRRK